MYCQNCANIVLEHGLIIRAFDVLIFKSVMEIACLDSNNLHFVLIHITHMSALTIYVYNYETITDYSAFEMLN